MNISEFLISASDILNLEAEPIEWIIGDLVPNGAVILISAPPSAFKTWLVLDIARCVSGGVPFLGRATCRKDVIYIDKENPRDVLRQRLKKLGVTLQTPLKIWPHWGSVEPPSFKKNGVAPKEYQELAKSQPLIIMDSQIRFYPLGTEENKSTDINIFMSAVRSLTRLEATVILLHHAGKGEFSEYRGSSDILGGVDIAYTIKKLNSRRLHIKCIKNRYLEEKEFDVEIVSTKNSMRFEDAEKKITEEREGKERAQMEAIADVIRDFNKGEKRSPNQSELLRRVKGKLGLGDHAILGLLTKGEGVSWQTETLGSGRPTLYAIFEGTSSPPQPIYSPEEVKRSSDENTVEDGQSRDSFNGESAKAKS